MRDRISEGYVRFVVTGLYRPRQVSSAYWNLSQIAQSGSSTAGGFTTFGPLTVGLGEHTKQRPGELSGGQQQRVAIARALAGSPQVLLADEPTGQLDSETGKQIMRLLHAVVESEGVTALVATHDPNLISMADTVLELEDGQIKDSA
jgi:predicted ABC-type transport system involved in lysophospholipase L1 biosynthesis ATPase subunit